MSTVHATIIFNVPVKEHRRTKFAAKKLQVPVAAIARDGLYLKLAEIDKKLRLEEELENADKQIKKHRGLGSLGGIGDSKLAPTPLKSYGEQQEAKKDADSDPRLEIIYRHHAALVHAALANPIEKRLRIAEALVAVRDETPITEPPESEILATLEHHVMALRAKTAPTTPPVRSSLLTTPTPTMNVVSPSPLPPTRFASVMTGKTVPETKAPETNTKTKK